MNISNAAKILSRKGARLGGQARALSLTREQRREIALKAARARWKDHIKKVK